MTASRLQEALQRGGQQWPHAVLSAFSVHGLTPTGQGGLWCFLFRGDGVVHGLAFANNAWSELLQPPVPLELLPAQPLDASRCADVGVLAQTYCGQAGFTALDGREEDALWMGHRDGRLVAVITGAGGATLTVDGTDPSVVLAMDFVPVTLPGERV